MTGKHRGGMQEKFFAVNIYKNYLKFFPMTFTENIMLHICPWDADARLGRTCVINTKNPLLLSKIPILAVKMLKIRKIRATGAILH